NLRRKGSPIDDIDILIDGVAIANDLVLTTRNEQHFGRIEGLEIENWSNP
ncbi:MAG: type II toxin-antitoxin system VapC family toxin, partial [Leptolyngbyaceae cyanobacterium CAN_BIN12]|nr:type II toxin-antitoxin system VapC family toxin [Leptolyngbyaceae cyanobacterium CAN_BIN12]